MNWAEIITSLGALVGAIGGVYAIWTKYNQDTKNKRTDYELERLRNEDKVRNRRRSDNAMAIYGVLWEILYRLNADRAYIVQPHPLNNEEMLTIYFEVKRNWAEPMKPHIQRLKISEVAKFASELSRNLFMYLNDIPSQVEDRYAQSIFSSCGAQGAIVKRLSDNRQDWVGSIICEFTDEMTVSEKDAQEPLRKAATDIQYILPEIRD
jgi:hypothetical protein